ncbi:MAG: cytochrome c3 family protein [Gemmatimonadota bacterium]|nr:cytochrome c3 family protein [Gemmatimonadota bacterium]
MIPALLFLLQQGPEAHYGGGTASGTTAGAVSDPTGQLFRFLLSTVPQWVQIAGILIGGPVALIIARQVWKNRRNLWAWFLGRSRAYKLAIAGTGGFVILVVGFVGVYNYNYVMHKNDFCQSCHLMDSAWNRFQVSAHKDLQCHACHRQPLWVSSKELFWWVYERRMAVPAHDKVPTAVCSECHLRATTDSSRTNVLRTAGHVIHLKSDSTALKDVECVTCHGRDFHLFRPNNATCSQAGCHTNTRVKLGAMSNAGFLHCTTCHGFRTPVPQGETVAEAKRAVAPKELNCTACHQMSQEVLKWDLAKDPHKASCGSCHNPHKQEQPKDAFQSCAAAQCHANADTLTAFHRGLGSHGLDNCGACHQAHSWKVNGTDCLACHKTIYQNKPGAVRRSGTSAAPPPPLSPLRHESRGIRIVPADTAAVRPIAWTWAAPAQSASRGVRSVRRAPLGSPARIAPHASTGRTVKWAVTTSAAVAPVAAVAHAPRGGASSAAGLSDSTFLHSRHKGITCTSCHGTSGATHGALKISAPRDCLACHHGQKQAATCATCHATASLAPRPQSVTLRVSARPAGSALVTRALSFAHARHAKLECARCHAANDQRTVTTTCTSCHADHHQLDRDCASCHPAAKVGHDLAAHDGCAGCHAAAQFVAATLTRSLCLACHQEQRDHYIARDCATCHAVPAHPAAAAGARP